MRYTRLCSLTLLLAASDATLSSLSAAPNNSLLDISTDGQLQACANLDSGTVTVVDLKEHRKLHEVPVGRHPEGLSFSGESHLLVVAVYDDDKIVWLDADAGKKTSELEVFDEPYGVVSDRAGTKLY